MLYQGIDYPESYITLSREVSYIYKEKGSEFIAKAFPVQDTASFEERRTALRKEFYDAVHHCFAYSILGSELKYSDDGEPSGTAGIRILNALEHEKVLNTAVIVIRYFGGIKLGVGPLGKAYYHAAQTAVASGGKITRSAFIPFTVVFPFEESSTIYRMLEVSGCRISDTKYGESAAIDALAGLEVFPTLKKDIETAAYRGISATWGKEALYR